MLFRSQRIDTDARATVAAVFDEREEGWLLRIERRHHGNVRVSTIDAHFLLSADHRTLVDCAQTAGGLVREGAEVRRGDGDRQRVHAVGDFREAMRWLTGEAERNLGRQRYKGLGEMNAEQLWETTLNPDTRRLLQVSFGSLGFDATAAAFTCKPSSQCPVCSPSAIGEPSCALNPPSVLRIMYSGRPNSDGVQPMPAFCVRPNKSPLAHSRSIDSVNGRRPDGPDARVRTS